MFVKSLLHATPAPGDFFMDICINVTSSEKVPFSDWDTTKSAPQFSLNSRHERTIKGKTKAYVDAVFNPKNLPPKPKDGRNAVNILALDAVLGEVLHTESAKSQKALVPGGLPTVETAKYMGDTKVRRHIIRLVGQAPKPGNPLLHPATSAPALKVPSAPTPAVKLIEELNEDISTQRSTPGFQPQERLDGPSTSLEFGGAKSQSLYILKDSETLDSKEPKKTETINEKKEQTAKGDDRALKDGGIRIPGRMLVEDDEFDEWLSSADAEVSKQRRDKLYSETNNSSIDIFAATRSKPVRGINKKMPLIVELDPNTKEEL